MQKKDSFRTQNLITIAFLIALEIVLTRFVSINTSFLRIGFGFLPIAVCGILYGPLAAGFAYAFGDLLGGFLFPSGPFFPGFTLSAFLTGLIYGYILHNHKITFGRTFFACSIVMLGVNLVLGTCWISILYGKSFMVLLPARIFKELVMIPICTFLIMAVDKLVLRFLHTKKAV